MAYSEECIAFEKSIDIVVESFAWVFEGELFDVLGGGVGDVFVFEDLEVELGVAFEEGEHGVLEVLVVHEDLGDVVDVDRLDEQLGRPDLS
jgi:hypothetical protein